jgi:hypothetical protein
MGFEDLSTQKRIIKKTMCLDGIKQKLCAFASWWQNTNKLVPYYAKAISKFKVITEIITSTNSVDEVNSIAYASFRTTFIGRNERKSSFGSRKRRR